MKQVKLSDIIPTKPEFFIKSVGQTFEIRPPNLEDQQWIAQRYPAQADIARIFSNREWKEICVMVYRHLDTKGRAAFKPRKGVKLNDDGADEEIMLTGPEVLLVNLKDPEEAAKMLGAMVRAMVLARPDMEEIVATEVKKNWHQLQAALGVKPIGQKSLTSSRRNTGGAKPK